MQPSLQSNHPHALFPHAGQMILVTPVKTSPSQTATSAVAEGPAAAPPQFQCNTCCRKFNSIGAMEQHQHNKGCSSSSSSLSHVNSPFSAPPPQFQCNTCCRKFDSIGAMEQHQLDKGCNSSSRDGNAALQRGMFVPMHVSEISILSAAIQGGLSMP